MGQKKKKLLNLLDLGKGKKIIIVCGILGMVLILLSSITDLKVDAPKETDCSVKEYKTTMQEELKQILYIIDGVGNVEVLLTIENSVEGVYLENNSTKTKEIEPIIRGVVIACQGGDVPLVKERVLNAVTKALNISSAKVCVTKLKE